MTETDVQHDHNEAWDDSDIRALRHFFRQGMTQQQIAVRMGRTVCAVNSKVYRLRRAGTPVTQDGRND